MPAHLSGLFDLPPNVERRVRSCNVKPPDQRAPEEQLWVEAVTTAHPHAATDEQLAQQFRQVFRERNPDAFKSG
jgi:hypothetical protein